MMGTMEHVKNFHKNFDESREIFIGATGTIGTMGTIGAIGNFGTKEIWDL
jgi:PDZ domain-containing secreted protein